MSPLVPESPQPFNCRARSPRGVRLLALAWVLVVLLAFAHQWIFWRGDRLDTDVLALLPQSEQSPDLSLAMRQMTDSATQSIIVLIGADSAADARSAAGRFDVAWREHDAALIDRASPALATGREAMDALLPWRDRLLTVTQRQHLQHVAPEMLAEVAIAKLYQPGAGLSLPDWRTDPIGLWPQWWSERLAGTPVRPNDGLQMFHAEGRDWVMLSRTLAGSAFALDGKAVHGNALEAAESAARELVPQIRVLVSGIPLHAEAAAVRANEEINLIGLGSLAAIVLLMWLAFRSLWPIVLVLVTLVVGCMVALSVTALVFDKVHLITLVFGASLVGVAEDFGIHYFASRVGRPDVPPRSLLRLLLPGLLLALCTSVIAYLMLGLAPFPGLRQMALFSAVGLTAAFATMACWFTVLDRGQVRSSAFACAISDSLTRWPRVRKTPKTIALAGVLSVLAVTGVSRLEVNDDLRQLQSSPLGLVQSQRDVQRLLQLPSTAQFLWVRGATTQEVLEREEKLTPLLDALVTAGALKHYVALSDWVPSLARQHADALLTARVETRVLNLVGKALGETLVRPAFDAAPLAPQDFLFHPASAALSALWLADAGRGPSTLVLLQGLAGAVQVASVRSAVSGLDGVHWVDKIDEISVLMARYRGSMSLFLLIGYAAVLLALWWRFGRLAWRAWVPTVLAAIFTLAALGWLRENFQLFNVLALILLLGIGVDYGIFLLEHDGDGSAWLAVVLGAGSTLLSFGLLGFSNTPALRAFGLTMALGTACVWLLSPMFRLDNSLAHAR